MGTEYRSPQVLGQFDAGASRLAALLVGHGPRPAPSSRRASRAPRRRPLPGLAGHGTERRHLALVLVAMLSGCISTGIRDDLTLVRELAHASELPDVARPVDDEPHDDVAAILARPIDADAAVRVAMLNNRELRASLRELGIARARVLGAGLLPNPLFDVELNPERQTGVEVRVEWDIAGLLLAPIRADAASADLDVARFEVAGLVIETGFEVRSAYFEVQAADEMLAVAERALDACVAARDAARALASAGNVPAMDLAAREAAYEEERVHVAEAELHALVARELLQRRLGLHGEETAWTTAGPLPVEAVERTDLDGLERRAVDASLELRVLQSRMVAAARRAGLARLEGMLPEVLVDVHALIGDPVAGDSFAVGGGIGVRLPIFDRGDGLVAEHEHALDAAFERYVGLAVDVRSEAREARARVESSGARVRHYGSVVLPARQRVLDEVLLQYDAMQVSVFDLLDAVRERQRTERDAIETRREHRVSLARLDALLAGHRVHDESGASRMSGGE